MLEDPYDSEDEVEDLYDADEDADGDADGDEDKLDVDGDTMMGTGTPGADDATEDGDDETGSDTESSDDDEEEEEEEEEEEVEEFSLDLGLTEEVDPPPLPQEPPEMPVDVPMHPPTPPPRKPSPPRVKPLSAAQIRRNNLAFSLDRVPRSYTVEAICALPHQTPIHALAASACMTHLITGSQDGYIRNYDIFSAVNSKNFLTAPQRAHAGVVEGLMKSGQLRFWWENPALAQTSSAGAFVVEEETNLAPVYSLAMQSDALWALAGTEGGYINLFTVRHDPGKLCHVLGGVGGVGGHSGRVSGLALDYDEKGLFSGGWDGEAIQWDLNSGQHVRNFTAHKTQLTAIAIRPISSGYVETGPANYHQHTQSAPDAGGKAAYNLAVDAKPTVSLEGLISMEGDTDPSKQGPPESDARSDTSFDPLFDEDEPPASAQQETKYAVPGSSQPEPMRIPTSSIPPPKGAPDLFDPTAYATSSPDLLMTAYIDGQVILWDRRVQSRGKGVGRLEMNDKTPPWCLSACWSADGAQIYAGRRNETVDVWDVRVLGQSGPLNTPRMLKTLKNPQNSGVVSCVVAFPDCRHIASASVDNVRLWNVAEAKGENTGRKSSVQFKIIPGHHGGFISQMLIDSGNRFLVTASSDRGWHGESTRTVFVHDIKYVQ